MSKKKSSIGYTKQGVRDLSGLQSKSVGRKYEPPPVIFGSCSHPKSSRLNETNERTGLPKVVCGECGYTVWEKRN